jgi:hypothetical protein
VFIAYTPVDSDQMTGFKITGDAGGGGGGRSFDSRVLPTGFKCIETGLGCIPVYMVILLAVFFNLSTSQSFYS